MFIRLIWCLFERLYVWTRKIRQEDFGVNLDEYECYIDARALHKELNVGKNFTNWIKGRINKYEFIENEDYKLDSPKRANQNSHGGDRKSLYYSLTLDI